MSSLLRRVLAGVAATLLLATAGYATDNDGGTGHARHSRHADHPDHTAHAAHAYTYSEAQQAAIVAQAAAPLRGSEFRADCFSSHRRGDDPIVFPGQAGRSHIHEFYGNRTANASSTLESLSAGTTNCTP